MCLQIVKLNMVVCLVEEDFAIDVAWLFQMVVQQTRNGVPYKIMFVGKKNASIMHAYDEIQWNMYMQYGESVGKINQKIGQQLSIRTVVLYVYPRLIIPLCFWWNWSNIIHMS